MLVQPRRNSTTARGPAISSQIGNRHPACAAPAVLDLLQRRVVRPRTTRNRPWPWASADPRPAPDQLDYRPRACNFGATLPLCALDEIAGPRAVVELRRQNSV